MKIATKAALVMCAIGLSACGSSLFNRGGAGADGPGGLGGDQISASALDASSPAYFSQTIGNTVLFAVDKSSLSDEARSILTQQADWLNTNTSYNAIIEGHADEQGTRSYNLALGSSRAASARDFLVSRGVADTRIQILSFGKERPLEVCSTELCYAKNRRAVSVISAGVGS